MYERFRDIPQYTGNGYCKVLLPIVDLEEQLARYIQMGLQLNLDFQRGHVWGECRQVAFVEHVLRGGKNNLIRANHPDWQRNYTEGEFVLVDGLQRLIAVLRFVRGEETAEVLGSVDNSFQPD